jgi:hypothetical protein
MPRQRASGDCDEQTESLAESPSCTLFRWTSPPSAVSMSPNSSVVSPKCLGLHRNSGTFHAIEPYQ